MTPFRSAVRRIGCGLAAAVASALLLFVALEVILRLAVPQPLLHDPDAYVPDPVLGARLKPGFSDQVSTTEHSSRWEINSEGYRGPAAGSRSRTGIRIAALGDSFTFGYGVEEAEAWPRWLEEILDEVEVLNLGVGGYGTWQEAAWLEDRWDRIRPDVAVIAFYPGNDLADNLREERRRAPSDGAGTPAGDDTPRRAERWKRWWASRSHLYSFVSSRAGELLVRLGLRQVVYPGEMEVLLARPPEHVELGWESTRRALSHLAELARVRNMKLLVVYVPMKHEVSEQVWSRVRDYYGRLTGVEAAESLFDRGGARRRLEEVCGALGTQMLDLSGALQASGGDPAALYWERDQHFNGRGHESAAAAIARRLREASWVPDGNHQSGASVHPDERGRVR